MQDSGGTSGVALVTGAAGGYQGLRKGETPEQCSQLIALGRVQEPEDVAGLRLLPRLGVLFS